MINLKRLSVVMSVFGTSLVFAACASPTDAEIAEQPAQQEDVTVADGAEDIDVTSSALVDEAAETAEEAAQDVAEEAEQTAEDVMGGEEGSEAQKQGFGQPGSGGQDEAYGGRSYRHRPGGHYGRRGRCNYRDVVHCVRGHRGWRWVDLGRGHRPRRYGDHGHRRRGNYCCMRVLVRDHRGRGY